MAKCILLAAGCCWPSAKEISLSALTSSEVSMCPLHPSFTHGHTHVHTQHRWDSSPAVHQADASFGFDLWQGRGGSRACVRVRVCACVSVCLCVVFCWVLRRKKNWIALAGGHANRLVERQPIRRVFCKAMPMERPSPKPFRP